MARGVTTEWEDIHVAKGNWKALEHVPTSDEIFYNQQEKVENYENWKDMNAEQIEDAIEDDLDLEDDDYLTNYRQQRMAEMKAKSNIHAFSFGMLDISKKDYEWHIKNMPEGSLGVILLYQDQ